MLVEHSLYHVLGYHIQKDKKNVKYLNELVL